MSTLGRLDLPTLCALKPLNFYFAFLYMHIINGFNAIV